MTEASKQASEELALIELRGLQKYFPLSDYSSVLPWKKKPVLRAVDSVNLKIRRGETVGLVGESGCGKSTLGRTLLKLYEPSGGQILFRGEDITFLSEAKMRPKRRHMQLIFQDPYSSLNPRMTVGEILSEPFFIHGLVKENPKERVQNLLHEVGLNPESYSRYPHEFSGGQRQRIGIARSIALSPDLIVCDEPVSALDVSIQSQILNLLSELKVKRGLSYLFIAHDLAVVQHISDVIAVMYMGRIVEMADRDDLYVHPMHPYTRILIDSIPSESFDQYGHVKKRTISQMIEAPRSQDPEKSWSEGCQFFPRCPLATDLCRTVRPELKIQGDEHQKYPHSAACHHI